MQKLIPVALLLGLFGCASGPETHSAPRPSGSVAPCPAYANFETVQLPDARGLLQAFDSLYTHALANSGANPVIVPFTSKPRIKNAADLSRIMKRVYPAPLRDAGVQGSTEVALLIAADGSVRDARVLRSSGQSALDLASVRTAQQMIFHPAQNGICPVPHFNKLPITWRIDRTSSGER